MSLFDKLKSRGKKALGDFQARTARVKVLRDLNKTQLYELGAEFGVPLTKSMSKEEMIEKLAGRSELTVKKIMRKGLKKSKKKRDVLRTKKIVTKATKRKTSVIESKLRKQLNSFNPIIGKRTKERNVEAQLVQRLQAVLGDEKINYQERTRAGRTDIVVANDYAIEIKLMTSPSQLTPLIGQALRYSKIYSKLFIWIYDVRKSLKKADINRFKTDLKDHLIKNVEVIVK